MNNFSAYKLDRHGDKIKGGLKVARTQLPSVGVRS